MTGSIQEKNGKLYAVLCYKDETGTSKRKWVGTGLPARGNKKRAEAILPEILAAHASLEPQKTSSVLFADYIRTWLENKRADVQQSTWEGYEIYVNRHILPYFEPLGLTIDQVTPKHIQDYYESRLTCRRSDHKSGGLKPVSVKKHAPVLNQIFKEALIGELVARNPVSMVPLPKQEHDRVIFGSCYTESPYIFVWSDSKPYRPDYITSAFKKVLARNHLPEMRFHDLRHSTASILYDKGWELKDIQEWLGHADISTTGNIYTHISKLRKEKMGSDLGQLFKL